MTPRLEVPAPGEHGDDAARVATALGLDPREVLDLATSLNPVAPDLRLLVATTLDSMRRYPDATGASAAMAAALGAETGHVLLTNGGAEAIALVAGELEQGAVDGPEFSLYRRHLARIEPTAGRWRSNPNNPTGCLAAPEDTAAVWDEAFYPLATGSWTRGDAASGSVVVGSLTKLLACPGLRLGYLITTDDTLMERLARRQPRWSVSSIALAALPRLLDLVDLPGWQRSVAVLRDELDGVLRTNGYEPDPSDANFVLVREARGLRDRLARLGVVVRDCASFGLPGAVRIAVPCEAGLERLAEALGRAGGGDSARSKSPYGPKARGVTAGVGRGPDRRPEFRGTLLVCGTSSDAGKSQIVTGLCRLLSRRGVRVAPFKAQNMSLNSYATPSGHEIGRAQGIQALAARIEPEVGMNPILLKPTSHRSSQVVVMGEPLGDLDSRTYLTTRRAALLPTVLAAFNDLRERFDVVICEGAGSPAEVNLLEGDLVNLGFADAAGVPALLVGDIERGGVFASIAGTFAVLPEHLARHLRAFAINKFRGDANLLTPGIETIERLIGRPCAGVLPWLEDLHLDAEDSLGLAGLLASSAMPSPDKLDVAVIALPHLANFTDLDALSIEPGLSIRLVDHPSTLGNPDLLILPGSKSTVADLAWMRERGLAEAITRAAGDPVGPTILGVCAGYQMLGHAIEDEYESGAGRVTALGLLPIVTAFSPSKLTRPRTGSSLTSRVSGYEIHQGEPVWLPGSDATSLVQLDDGVGTGPEGCVSADGRVAGTSLHGLFESDDFRAAWLDRVARRRSKSFVASGVSLSDRRESQIDRLADAVEEFLDLDLLAALISSTVETPA
ncbi:MAG: cobyric acid synthase [Acidimicrobiales bacterium]